LTTSDHTLQSIQEKIKWADMMSEANRKHKKEVEDRVEEVKKTMKVIKAGCGIAILFFFQHTTVSLISIFLGCSQ
jgi:predicted protein tyrosine phosphatase